MLRIRNFGNDRDCDSPAQVLERLVADYRGRSVSITFSTKPRGLLTTLFVDVAPDGMIRESYGDRNPVTLAAFSEWDGGESEGAWMAITHNSIEIVWPEPEVLTDDLTDDQRWTAARTLSETGHVVRHVDAALAKKIGHPEGYYVFRCRTDGLYHGVGPAASADAAMWSFHEFFGNPIAASA